MKVYVAFYDCNQALQMIKTFAIFEEIIDIKNFYEKNIAFDYMPGRNCLL